MLLKRKRKRGGAIEGMPAYPRRLDRPGKTGLLPTEASDPGEVEPKVGDGARYLLARAAGGRTEGFHPGGEKGKLHREIGVPVGEKIPAGKLAKAERSSNPEIRRDAIRAKTMEGWKH